MFTEYTSILFKNVKLKFVIKIRNYIILENVVLLIHISTSKKFKFIRSVFISWK